MLVLMLWAMIIMLIMMLMAMVIILISAMNKQYVFLVIRMEVMLINYVISLFFKWMIFFRNLQLLLQNTFVAKEKMMKSGRCSFAVWKRYQLFIPACCKDCERTSNNEFLDTLVFTRPYSSDNPVSPQRIQMIIHFQIQ